MTRGYKVDRQPIEEELPVSSSSDSEENEDTTIDVEIENH